LHLPTLAETFNALLLAKSLRQRLWTDSQLETRQLAGIGPLIAQRLAAAGVHKLRQLAEVEPRRLEALAQRHYPFGEWQLAAGLSLHLPRITHPHRSGVHALLVATVQSLPLLCFPRLLQATRCTRR
jgi:hypothetical protein